LCYQPTLARGQASLSFRQTPESRFVYLIKKLKERFVTPQKTVASGFASPFYIEAMRCSMMWFKGGI